MERTVEPPDERGFGSDGRAEAPAGGAEEQPAEGDQTDGRAHEPAPADEQADEEEGNSFDGPGSVQGFSGSFWDAVATQVIPKPDLMGWNDWQHTTGPENGTQALSPPVPPVGPATLSLNEHFPPKLNSR